MKFKKKLLFIFIIVFLFFNLYIYTQAFAGGVLVNNVISYMKSTNRGITQANIFTNIVSTIIAVGQVAAIAIVIIRFSMVGIKYFTVKSVNYRADLKNQLFNVFWEGVVVFGVVGIFRIAYELLVP